MPTASNHAYIDNGGTGITGYASYLYVGNSGMGILNLIDGGTATSANSVGIGYYSGSTGTVVVDGDNSLLQNTGAGSHLYVGNSGTGTLNLENGGKATSESYIYIGLSSDSSGTVTVTGTSTGGAASELKNESGALFVGHSGTGTLNLTDGGKATAASHIFIGYNTNSDGTVMVGTGSTLTSATDNVYVGGSDSQARGNALLAGNGTVIMTDTSKAVVVYNTGTLSAGDKPGEIGTLTITGNLDLRAGSTLRVDIGAANASDCVAVSGTATLGRFNIDLSGLRDGNYTPITWDSVDISPTPQVFTLNGLELAGRAAGKLSYESAASDLMLTISDVANKYLTWTGATDGNWDITTVNWNEDGGDAITFLDGDAVTFANTADTTINILGTQKTVAQMLVTGTGDLTINGNIVGDRQQSTISYGDLTDPGRLVKTGTGTLNLNGTSHFTDNIYLDGGETNIGTGSELSSVFFYVGLDNTASLNLTDGGKTTSRNNMHIGFDSNSTGTVNVGKGAHSSNQGSLYVGNSGTGTLNLTDGGKATSAYFIHIGYNSGSTGTVDIGKDSELNCGGALSVGHVGTGTLNLTDGGKATAGTGIHIGRLGNSTGTVMVGKDSLLEGGGLYVGEIGTGTLNLTGGGKATATSYICIGMYDGSSGTVMVGKDSELTSTGDNVYVGGDRNGAAGTGLLTGTGTVTANGGNGAVVVWETATLSAGDKAGEIGTLNIDGKLDLQDGATIHVDFNNNGSAAGTNQDHINVTGTVTFGNDLNISLSSLANTMNTTTARTIVTATGTMDAAPTTVNLTLNGLSLDNSRVAGSTVGLQVGGAGNKELQITDITLGGDATNKFVTWNTGDGVWDITTKNWYENTVPDTPIQFLDGDAVTFNIATDDDITVTIDGTQKTVAQMLVTGDGDLTINGNILGNYRQSTISYGDLTNPSRLRKTGTGALTLNGNSHFASSITLDGGKTNIDAGSELSSGDVLRVGLDNTASLNLTNGGKVTSANSIYIGDNPIGNGTVTVDGAGSELKNTGSVCVGFTGKGTLELTNGGKATSASNILIGMHDGSTGEVHVGAGSVLQSTGGDLRVGDFGTGTLELTNGGNATTTGDICIGWSDGSTGEVLVGAGSTLESTGNNVYVGGDWIGVGGTGTLTGTGTVSANGDIIVYNTGTLSAGDVDKTTGTLNLIGNLDLRGATIAIDLGDDGSTSDLLDITGDLNLGTAGSNILNFTELVNGTYTLMTFTGDFDLDDTTADGNFTVLVGGEMLSGRQNVSFANSGLNSIVIDIDSEVNKILTWNGAAGNVWMSTNAWLDDADDAETFIYGDAAIFIDNGAIGDVTVDLGTGSVAYMRVEGGSYIFTGDTIKSTDSMAGDPATETLVVTGDTTSATFETALNFKNGITITDGADATLAGAATVETADKFTVDATSSLTFEAVTGKLAVGELDIDDDAKVTVTGGPKVTGGATQVVENVITSATAIGDTDWAEQLTQGTGLRSQYAEFNSTFTAMDMVYKSASTKDFADINGLRENIVRLGWLLDETSGEAVVKPYYDWLYDLGSDEEIVAALDRLGAGEVAADAQTMALWSPWRRTNSRLYEKMADVNYTDATIYGQNCCTQGQWWFEGHYIADNVSTSADAVGYHQRRGGMIIGVDWQVSSTVTAGAMFAYGQPRAYNRLAKVEADDYTLGLYGQFHLCEYLYANAFLGYGRQEYSYTNRGTGFDTSYDGDTLYASLEFVRPVFWNTCLTLLPLVAVDYQQTWTDGFTDAGGQLAVQYDDGSMAQVLLRLGLNSRYTWSDRVNLTTRLQYAHNFADQYGELDVSFVGAPGQSTMFRGASLGRDLLNLGIGGELLVGSDGRTRLYADYDFYVSDHATSHTGFFGIERKW